MYQKEKAGGITPAKNHYERSITESALKTQVQLTLRDEIRQKTEREFIAARNALFTATTPTERATAIEQMDTARTRLILHFDYTLEELAALVDREGAA